MDGVKRITALIGALTCFTHGITASAQTVVSGSVTTTTTCLQNADQTFTCTTPASSFTLSGGIIVPPTLTAPGQCTAAASFASVAVGSTILPQLSVSCITPGTGPLSYAWTKVGSTAVVGRASTYQLTAADIDTEGVKNYGVVVSNAVGTAPMATVGLTVTAAVRPPTVGGINYCPSGQVQNAAFDASQAYVRLNSTNLVGPNTVYVVKLTVPVSGASTAGRYPAALNHIEAPGEVPNPRAVSLSRNLCDFDDVTTLLGPITNVGASELSVQDPYRGYRNLEAGVWYISVKPDRCATGKRCNVALEWVNY